MCICTSIDLYSIRKFDQSKNCWRESFSLFHQDALSNCPTHSLSSIAWFFKPDIFHCAKWLSPLAYNERHQPSEQNTSHFTLYSKYTIIVTNYCSVNSSIVETPRNAEKKSMPCGEKNCLRSYWSSLPLGHVKKKRLQKRKTCRQQTKILAATTLNLSVIRSSVKTPRSEENRT